MGEFGIRKQLENNKISPVTHDEKRRFGSVKAVPESRKSTGDFGKFLIDRRLENHFLAAQTSRTFYSLLPYLELVQLSAEDRIYEAGEDIDFVYFPETAIFSEFRTLESGNVSEIAMTGIDGVVGLLSLCGSQRAFNWTQVLVPGNAYRISPQILNDRMAVDAAFRNAILRLLTNYIDQVSKRAVCNKFHSLEQRICTWLLMVQDRRKMAKMPLTHQQIGLSLSVQRSCVANAARELKKKKIITYVRGKMTILNRDELMRSACDCCSEMIE